MKRSEQINEIATALAKAQKAFKAAEREHTANVETKSGGQYSFNYADLAAYLDVCREPLGNAGLSFLQEPINHGADVTVTTLLLHESGQWIESEPFKLTMIADSRGEFTPQIVGSAVTYARRYSLSALIGMASEADDDANAASGNTASVGKRPEKPACPKCGNNSHVIAGKAEYGGGWLCWKNKGGCGEKWHDPHMTAEMNGKAPEDQERAAAARAENPPPPETPRCTQQQQDAIRDIGAELRLQPGYWNSVLKTYKAKRLTWLTPEQASEVILDLSRRRVSELLTEHAISLDDVRERDPFVTADIPEELDQDQASAALVVLREMKERQTV